MVNKQVIASSLFSKRGKLPPTLMRSLYIRGSGIHVDDCLRRFGWDGAGAAITTVININGEAGTVAGVRFESRGRGPVVTFKASDLWKDADSDVTVKISIDNLSLIKWRTQGNSRNQSHWLDSGELNVCYMRGEGVFLESREDLEAAKVGGFSVRLTVQPLQVDRMVLYGGILPMSKTDLEAKVGDADVNMDSPAIPTLALKLWQAKGRPQNGYPMAFIPVERKEDFCGFGHLPLLESVGSADPKMPTSDEIEQQLCLFLRNITATNNVAPHQLDNLMEPRNFPSSVSGMLLYNWPEYRGPLSDRRSRIASCL